MKERYILTNDYLGKICRYNFNDLWLPKLGDLAIKKPNGIYLTRPGTLVSLNQADMIFINTKNFKNEYMWIPTLEDLIKILGVCVGELLSRLNKVDQIMINECTMERILLELVIEYECVSEEKGSTAVEFIQNLNMQSSELDSSILEKKEDFMKQFK